MKTTERVGRIIGVLLLVQALLAVPVYTQWGMLGSVTAPDFLVNAAGSAMQIRGGVLLTYVLSALTLAVALIALPVVRRHSERMAFLFLALSVVGLATQVIEAVATRDLLSMSMTYAQPNASKDFLENLGAMAHSSWTSAHFSNLMLGHIKAFVFFVIMYRFALVPRLLGGVGMAATILSTAAAIMPLFGYPFSYPMVAPTALTQFALTLWLIVKGFDERPDQHHGETELSGA